MYFSNGFACGGRPDEIIKLDVQAEGFEEGKFYPANECTYLNIGDGKTLEFPVPGVKGYLPKTTATVKKVWSDSNNQDGKRSNSVKVVLYAGNSAVANSAKTLSAKNNWKASWDSLDKYKDGNVIAYSVKELDAKNVAVEDGGSFGDYKVTYTGDIANGFKVTNTHTPEIKDIEGVKKWDDKELVDNEISGYSRPASIKVYLHASVDKKEIKIQGVPEYQEISANNNWKFKFENLPVYSAGKLITYTVTESEDGYNSNVTGYEIVNTPKVELVPVHIVVKKVDSNTDNGLAGAKFE